MKKQQKNTMATVLTLALAVSSLTSLDLSSFDMSNVIDKNHMFSDCSSLITIKTPQKSSNTVPELSEGTWKDSSGQTYTTLPANATESITLTKE